jgi:GAF domain-containing protein/HAMP domain-containing protein
MTAPETPSTSVFDEIRPRLFKTAGAASAEHQSAATRFGILLAILFGVTFLFGLLNILVTGAGISFQIWTAFAISLSGLVCALMSRRGLVYPGVLQFLVVYSIASVLSPVFAPVTTILSGALYALLYILIVAVLATSALPRRLSLWALTLAGFFSAFILLISVYGPNASVIDSPEPIEMVIAGLMVAGFGAVIIRRYPTYSFQTKLLLVMLVLALAPTLTLSAMNIRVTQELLEETASNQLKETSNQVARAFDDYIATRLDAIRADAQLGDVVAYLSLAPEQRAGSEAEAHVRKLLDTLVRRDPVYISSYAILDVNGIDLIDTYADDIGLDKSDRDYFQEPFRTGLPYVSPLRRSETYNESSSIYFSAPVRTDLGESVGIIRARLNGTVVQGILNSVVSEDVYDHYSVVLSEDNYIRYAHSENPSLIFKSYAPLTAAEVADLQAKNILPPGSVDELVTSQPDVVSGLNNLDQEPVFKASAVALDFDTALSAAVRLENAPWIVLTRQALDLALLPVQSQVRAAALLAIIIVVIVTMSSVGVSQILTRPVVRLRGVAQRVAGGDLQARADVETQDEIGDLAESFNVMTGELQNTLASLEQRVADRTRAIELGADVSRRLSTILDPVELVSEVVDLLQFAFNYYHVHIYLFDEQRQNLVMVGGTGEAGQAMLAKGHSVPKGRGLVGRATETGMVVLVQDTQADPNWLPNPLLPETRSEAAIPIIFGDQVLGALDVQQNAVNGLSQQDADLLVSVANQVAIALRNARQYVQSQQQAQREADLRAMLQKIQSTQTMESALQVAVRELGRVLNASRTAARLKIEDRGNGESASEH